MSEVVDTQFDDAERAALLHEVEAYLPAFLSEAAVEQPDPRGDVAELLNLESDDLDRVIAVHVGLSEPVRQFLESLEQGLRRPITSSVRPPVATQAVRGSIDWGATIRHRARVGGAVTEFIVRPATRVFDTPENRALAYLLERLDIELRRALPANRDPAAGVYNAGWLAEIALNIGRVRKARRHHWLRGVPAERPDPRTWQRLSAARSRFYKQLIPNALRTLERFTEDPSSSDLTDLLCRRFFEPQRNWKLYELVVALRLARAFAEKSAEKRTRLLADQDRRPYAVYAMADAAVVRLWYEAWPKDAGPSVLDLARRRYAISPRWTTPDIVVERRWHGVTDDAVIIEIKATRSSTYLGDGLAQLYGYLKDRPALFMRQPSGWLVAPASSAFASADPEGSELWAVDGEAIATAMVTRFGY